MTKITNIDKAALLNMRAKIDAALVQLGEELGVSFHAGNGTYGGSQAHFKLEIKVADPAIQQEAARKEFETYCGLYDLEPSDFGIEFKAGRDTYRLVGLEMRRSKFPLRVEKVNEGNKIVLLGQMAAANIKLARAAKAAA